MPSYKHFTKLSSFKFFYFQKYLLLLTGQFSLPKGGTHIKLAHFIFTYLFLKCIKL